MGLAVIQNRLKLKNQPSYLVDKVGKNHKIMKSKSLGYLGQIITPLYITF